MKSVFLILWVGAIVVAGFVTASSQNVSDEARKHFNRGMAAVEMAKSQDDWESAIESPRAISGS